MPINNHLGKKASDYTTDTVLNKDDVFIGKNSESPEQNKNYPLGDLKIYVYGGLGKAGQVLKSNGDGTWGWYDSGATVTTTSTTAAPATTTTTTAATTTTTTASSTPSSSQWWRLTRIGTNLPNNGFLTDLDLYTGGSNQANSAMWSGGNRISWVGIGTGTQTMNFDNTSPVAGDYLYSGTAKYQAAWYEGPYNIDLSNSHYLVIGNTGDTTADWFATSDGSYVGIRKVVKVKKDSQGFIYVECVIDNLDSYRGTWNPSESCLTTTTTTAAPTTTTTTSPLPPSSPTTTTTTAATTTTTTAATTTTTTAATTTTTTAATTTTTTAATTTTTTAAGGNTISYDGFTNMGVAGYHLESYSGNLYYFPSNGARIQESSDSGSTWSNYAGSTASVDVQAPLTKDSNGIYFVKGVSSNNTVQRLDGTTVTLPLSNVSVGQIEKFQFVDGNYYINDFDGPLYQSSNLSSWTQVDSIGRSQYIVEGGGTIIYGGLSDTRRTTDDFSNTSSIGDQNFTSIGTDGSGNWVAHGTNAIMKYSTNDGVNWSNIELRDSGDTTNMAVQYNRKIHYHNNKWIYLDRSNKKLLSFTGTPSATPTVTAEKDFSSGSNISNPIAVSKVGNKLYVTDYYNSQYGYHEFTIS